MASGNKNIDVSIIIPVYNAEKTLPTLVASLLKENRINFEIIIINDGSTDQTSEVIKNIRDDRIILVEQENKGVYAARNLALSIHHGKWIIFLDADDEVSDDFIFNRITLASKGNYDVTIFNGHRIRADGKGIAVPIHTKQQYNRVITGHEWVKTCVQNREWPHYLWLQVVKSAYVKKHNVIFRQGYSHKDISWSIDLATRNGSFYISDIYDYTYINNAASITSRSDYFDRRALSYVDVISHIVECANKASNKDIKAELSAHALRESRHFLGLVRKKVLNKKNVCQQFNENVSLMALFKGIRSASDFFFFIKLMVKSRFPEAS